MDSRDNFASTFKTFKIPVNFDVSARMLSDVCAILLVAYLDVESRFLL